MTTSTLLRIATQHAIGTSSHSKVLKLRDQIKAAEVLLDAFGSCKTATCNNATRQGRILELHFSSDDAVTRILSGSKLLTFGFDRTRLIAPLGREERSFHVLYQFLAGASNEERQNVKLLSDPSQYNLLASSGTYRIDNVNDAIAFDELRAAFNTLGFKSKHLEMIYKILSAVLLLGNVSFSLSDSKNDDEDSIMQVSHETRDEFETVASLLGLPSDELERALVNKTSYVRKEVITSLLKEDGAVKQRDSLICSLYAILFSYIVESANHRPYPGDEAIKKLQRDKEGSSIVLLDIPGFQTKSPSGALLGDNTPGVRGNIRRNTLIHTYGEDGYDEFALNYSNELLQHWLHRRQFSDDSNDFVKTAIGDGVRYPEVDAVDTSEMTLELLRGGAIGSKADSKPGGLLGGLSKACSNLRKGKHVKEQEADEAFLDGLEERFVAHSRFIPRLGGNAPAHTFAIKHYTGTVPYSAGHFVEKDLDLLDAEFVRLFRASSSESFLAKLFSGPSLAAESHPRDPSVLVATQISSQPLRRLSPLKVSKSASTSVPSDAPEPDIEPVTIQINETLTDVLAQLNEIPVWSVCCIRPNDTGSPGIYDVRRIKSQVECLNLRHLLARKRVDYVDSIEISKFIKRYAAVGASGGANSENVENFLQEKKKFEKGRQYFMGATSVWLSWDAWFELEMGLVSKDSRDLQAKRKILAETQRSLEAKQGGTPAFPDMDISPSRDTFDGVSGGGGGGETKGGFYAGESSDDLLKNAGNAGGLQMPSLPYDNSRASGNYLRQSTMSLAPSGMGLAGASDVWGSDFKIANTAGGGGGNQAPGAAGNGKKGEKDGEGKKGQTVEEVPSSGARRMWLFLVWSLTWWIPSFLLSWVGRMKRLDVRLAWREKVALCMLVMLFCGSLVSCFLQQIRNGKMY